MIASASDNVFVGSVPEIYQTYLVPLIFEPYAVDLVRRVAARSPRRVLELAAGTGVVTRHLAAQLPANVSITATDLNQPMLDQATALGTQRPVEWRVGDAMELPFPDKTFDVVVCQFAVMFFPDKSKAFSEARRVLRPGGALMFNVWTRLEENEFADTVTAAVAALYPDDPPRFLARTPYGYHERERIEQDLTNGGFTAPHDMVTLSARSGAKSPRDPAIAFCQGTPLRDEIVGRNPSGVADATNAAAEAVARRFGSGDVNAGMRAHVVTAGKESR